MMIMVRKSKGRRRSKTSEKEGKGHEKNEEERVSE